MMYVSSLCTNICIFIYLYMYIHINILFQQKGPQCQAEVVTATHLYAYLHDQELPLALVETKTNNNSINVDSINDNNETSRNLLKKKQKIKELFHIADAFTAFDDSDDFKNNDKNINGSDDDNSDVSERTKTILSYQAEQDCFGRRSLLQQIKSTKEVYLNALYSTHDDLSAEIESNLSFDTKQRDCDTIDANSIDKTNNDDMKSSSLPLPPPHHLSPLLSNYGNYHQNNSSNITINTSNSNNDINRTSRNSNNKTSNNYKKENKNRGILNMIDIEGDKSKCSIICADDTTANFFNINVVDVIDDGLHEYRMMINDGSNEMINVLENICINHAIISTLVISHNKDNSSICDESNDEIVLLVLCRFIDDNDTNASSKNLYCAKVSLTSKDSNAGSNDRLSPLQIDDKNGIEKICLYIAPSSKSSRFGTSDDDGGDNDIDDDDMNTYNNDYMTENSSDEDENSEDNDIGDNDRIAAVIGIGKGSSNDSVCLFRIDFKNLRFVDITNITTANVPDSMLEVDSTIDFDSIQMETLHSLRLDVNSFQFL
jgi:hypothetical protein